MQPHSPIQVPEQYLAPNAHLGPRRQAFGAMVSPGLYSTAVLLANALGEILLALLARALLCLLPTLVNIGPSACNCVAMPGDIG